MSSTPSCIDTDTRPQNRKILLKATHQVHGTAGTGTQLLGSQSTSPPTRMYSMTALPGQFHPKWALAVKTHPWCWNCPGRVATQQLKTCLRTGWTFECLAREGCVWVIWGVKVVESEKVLASPGSWDGQEKKAHLNWSTHFSDYGNQSSQILSSCSSFLSLLWGLCFKSHCCHSLVVVPRPKVGGYLSAQGQPNEAPFSLPGWPLMLDVYFTCSNFQWILTLALCLSLAVSTFLGFWGPRVMLSPFFFSSLPFTFFCLCFSPKMVPDFPRASSISFLADNTVLLHLDLVLGSSIFLPLHLKSVTHLWSVIQVCLLLCISTVSTLV